MKNLLSKKPWFTVLPSGDGTPLQTEMRIQDDFIRQYYPSAHKIKDPMHYPDIWREIEEPVLDADGNDTGKRVTNIYVEKVPRFAFAFQQIITLKHLVHLTGNDIQFDLNSKKIDEQTEADANEFRDGWHDKGMEHAWYEFVKSAKITADTAFVAYIENGKFGYEVLSRLKGDKLYPHYGRDGRMAVFARSFNEYTEDGRTIEKLEVWDRTYLYRLHRATEPNDNPVPLTFGQGIDTYILEGFVYDDPTQGIVPHGYQNRVPVEYFRDEYGPCWNASQDSCDEFEIGFSQMAHNNKAYGEPILYLQGDNVESNHDMNGTIKTLTMGPEDKAGYLESQSASESYMKELGDLHNLIYEQSFIVAPPELKSGDLPAAALKILYSPAVEMAMNDAEKFTPSLDNVVYLFAFGFGVEKGKSLVFVNLPMRAWIKPYIHLSESTIMTDLATGVQNKFISRKTASERAWFYSVATEDERLAAEAKEDAQADILADYERQRFANQGNE